MSGLLGEVLLHSSLYGRMKGGVKQISLKQSFHKGLLAKITTADKLYTSCLGSQEGSIWIQRTVTLSLRFRRVNIDFMGKLKHTPTMYLPAVNCKHLHTREMLHPVSLSQPTHKCTHYHQNICAITAHFHILCLRPGNVFNNNSGNCSCVLLHGIVFFISRSSGMCLSQTPVWGLVPVLPDSYTYNEACWHHCIG